MREDFYQFAAQLNADKEVSRAAVVQRVQDRINGGWARHKCTVSSEICPGHGLVESGQRRSIRYHNLTAHGTVTIPTWSCLHCHMEVKPSAIQCGCFVSTPTDPEAWFDVEVLEAYFILGLGGGLIVTRMFLLHC